MRLIFRACWNGRNVVGMVEGMSKDWKYGVKWDQGSSAVLLGYLDTTLEGTAGSLEG